MLSVEAEARVQAAVDTAHMLERLLKEEKANQGEVRAALKVEINKLREEYADREKRLIADHEQKVAEYKSEIKRLRKQIVRRNPVNE